jgi:serine/threonine-protein kinase
MGASSLSSSDEQLELGSVLDGRYRIEGVLGTGGMGRVYRAEHTKIGKSVAIKVLHADLGRNREASQRFQREAIASGRLDHPNIVGVSDFGVLDDGACYLVMEVLEGESLGDRLTRDKRLAWTEAVDVLRGVLSGLRHAHERGVVHRDIKPDNVFLAHKDGDPVIKILDFGIAKLYAGSSDDPASTRAGLTVGTPAYLSPEQAVGGAITPASDLYSATVVLYEMLAGRAPFEDKDPIAMLGAHVGRRPPRLALIAPEVEIPHELAAIIDRGLMKVAAERIATASEYLAMLDGLAPPRRVPRARARSEPAQSRSHGASPDADARRTQDTQDDDEQAAHRGSTDSLAGNAAPPSGHPVTATLWPGMAASGVRPAALVATPLPTTAGAMVAAPVSLALASLPRAIRAVSLAEGGDPIPLAWIVRSSVVVGVVVVTAIALAIGVRCVGGAPPAAVDPAGSARPADRDAQLSALVRELEHGKTCAARTVPIKKLVELRDPRAVGSLRRARDRTGSGDDSNTCLRAEADRAVKALATK